MGTARAAIQVGIMVFLGAVLLISGYAFFRRQQVGNQTSLYAVTFSDAQGITSGADVDYSGVKVGEVDHVRLDNSGNALVYLAVGKEYRIPTRATVAITSSLLGSSAIVQIMPPAVPPVSSKDYYSPGASIAGVNTVSVAQLQEQAGKMMNQVGDLMGQVKVTTSKANALLDQATVMTKSLSNFVSDPQLQGGVKATVANLDAASGQGLKLAEQLRSMLGEDNNLAVASLRNVDSTTTEMASILRDNHSKINKMMTSLNQTTTQMDSLVTQANKTLTDGGAVQNFSDTMSNLKSASIKLNAIEDDLRSITGDKTVQTNLKTTIANAAALSGKTTELVARLDTLAGAHGHHFNFNPQTQLVFLQNFGARKFRADFDVYEPFGPTDYARLGVRDLTGSNLLNLQYGTRSTYNTRVSYRAGIYAAKIGVGLDYDVFRNDHFSADLYDPNLLRLDLRQRIPLSKQSALWFGLENVPRTNQVTLGFELRK